MKSYYCIHAGSVDQPGKAVPILLVVSLYYSNITLSPAMLCCAMLCYAVQLKHQKDKKKKNTNAPPVQYSNPDASKPLSNRRGQRSLNASSLFLLSV